jgi:hypothetical protein
LQAQHLPGQTPRLSGVIRKQDPPCLSTSSGQHLCLEYDALPDAIRDPVDLIDRGCHLPRWHRDAVSF